MSPTVPEEPTAAAALPSPPDRRRRLKAIPVALICALGLVLGYLFLSAKPEPGTPLGASAVVPGGTARIKGVVPLENDGWLPPEHVQALEEGPAAGAHRRRLPRSATHHRIRSESRDFTREKTACAPGAPIGPSLEPYSA